MPDRPPGVAKNEWLASCALNGDRCCNGKNHCDWVRYDVQIGRRYYPQICMTYGLEIKAGKKCQMCIDVAGLESL